MHNVCRTGPAIIAPNHISFFDSVVLIGVLPRRITYVGKAEYLDSWKTRYLLPAMGMIPIERTGGKRSMEALDTAAGVLDAASCSASSRRAPARATGCCTRVAPGWPAWRAHRCARSSPSASAAPTASSRPVPRVPRPFVRCEVHFGRPIEMSRYAGRTVGAATYRSITDEVMYEISQLSGQTLRRPLRRSTGRGRSGTARPTPSMPRRARLAVSRMTAGGRRIDRGQPKLNPLLMLGESRAMFEAAALIPCAPLLARAPRGDGHP